MTRDFLDSILADIQSESLTDTEWEGIDLPGNDAYTKETYAALKGVLENREGISGQTRRLKLYFLSRGVELDSSPVKTPNSQIFIGKPL